MITRRRFIAIAAASTMANPLHASGPARWTGRALGAEASVELHGMPAELLDDIPGELERLEGLFSLHDPTSALCQLNRRMHLEPPEAFSELVSLSDTFHTATGGLFDPTVQSVWSAVAEGRNREVGQKAVGWSRVAQSQHGLHLASGQALTFNGIAQGYATDRIARRLRAAGARKVLVNIGEIVGIGGPWRIGLSDPEIGIYGWHSLSNGAMATSSPAASHMPDGEEHLIHPVSGRRALWSSVTVEAADATTADALSTAFCFAQQAEIRAIVQRVIGVRRVSVVDRAGDAFRI